jgi:hypothetical protein
MAKLDVNGKVCVPSAKNEGGLLYRYTLCARETEKLRAKLIIDGSAHVPLSQQCHQSEIAPFKQ